MNNNKETCFLHGKCVRPDGTTHSHWTREVPMRLVDAPRSGQTQTGYGSRIPTGRMLFFNGRWRRVYVRIWSNIGTAYIRAPAGEMLTVSD